MKFFPSLNVFCYFSTNIVTGLWQIDSVILWNRVSHHQPLQSFVFFPIPFFFYLPNFCKIASTYWCIYIYLRCSFVVVYRKAELLFLTIISQIGKKLGKNSNIFGNKNRVVWAFASANEIYRNRSRLLTQLWSKSI